MVNQAKLVDPKAITVNSDHVSHRIANLKYGDHVCYLYETEEEHKAVLGPFLRQGLELDEKVLYIVDAHAAETVLQYLRDDGVILEPYLDSGQLSVLTSNDAYLRDRIFSPGGMITLLRSETKRALAEGYRALRVTDEMTWVLQELSGSERLNEYEAKLNGFFPGSKCLAMCQYDRRRFPSGVVINALRTHPIIIVGTKVYDNFYYVSHTEFLNQNIKDKALQHRLKNMEEHGQTKEALAISENRYRELADSLPQTVFETDERGKLVFVNRHFLDSTGFTPEDFRNGLDALQLLAPDDRNKARENMKRVLSGERLMGNKYKALKKDGSTFPIVSYSAPIIHEHKIIGIRGIVIDTTESNRIEHALNERVKELECLYRMANLAEKPGITLGELYQEAINILPPSWQYPEVACARITINGMEFRTDNYKDTAWKQSADIKVYGERVGTVEVIYLEMRPESDEGPFLKEERLLINDFTQRLGKITERRQMEKQIAAPNLEGQSRTVFTKRLFSPLRILTVTMVSIFLAEIFVMLLLFVLPPLSKQVEACDDGLLLTVLIFPILYLVLFRPLLVHLNQRKLVEEKWLQYHIHLEEMVAERTAELKSTNEQFQQEIKERKRAEQALQELYQHEENLRLELEKQIHQRTEFSRVLVHELKTPLTPVLGASRLLVDNLKEEPWRSLAVNISRGANNLNSRIDELLDLAKGEIGILQLDCEWVDPSKLLQDVLDYVGPEAKILGQILISDITPSLPQTWVDQERLRQVILNLLNNAFKFNPKGGKVTVKVRQRKDNLIVEIKDTGRGINEQEQERLFQPYIRLESDRDRFSGLGLGLSLSKMLIDLHGGRIWVKSQKGKGSIFGFSVPVKVTGYAA